MNRRVRAISLGMIPALVVSLLAASPALAADGGGSGNANDTAALIARVAPNQGALVRGLQTSSNDIAKVGRQDFTVPLDPAQPVAVNSSGSDGASFSVSLPAELRLKKGVLASDGTVVYKSSTGGADAAVQVLATGSTRIQAIIPRASSVTRLTYSFARGYLPVQAADGSIVVLGQDAQGVFGFATVAAAWARDSSGASVPTHYEVVGSSLIQVVEPTARTVFPVVADPSWQWLSGAYGLKFNRSETHSFAAAGSIAGMCVLFNKIAKGLAAIVCAAYGAYIFAQASIADSQKQCIFIAAIPAPLVYRYKDSYCK